ncbi:hypothetical protein BDW02DRAFT_319554 [Decorospora gaudefroyi]|uniref:Uncharacterized protein n=1 Tax=Decorospora gaudefroyi TaxID=184978 RepID=A0A6A5KGU0_9PLEO|nr:hypothetical protein BDW02DRAFT_319554 [Decorospora gaudefroyi]
MNRMYLGLLDGSMGKTGSWSSEVGNPNHAIFMRHEPSTFLTGTVCASHMENLQHGASCGSWIWHGIPAFIYSSCCLQPSHLPQSIKPYWDRPNVSFRSATELLCHVGKHGILVANSRMSSLHRLHITGIRQCKPISLMVSNRKPPLSGLEYPHFKRLSAGSDNSSHRLDVQDSSYPTTPP